LAFFKCGNFPDADIDDTENDDWNVSQHILTDETVFGWGWFWVAHK
jgi:hypothetical protein